MISHNLDGPLKQLALEEIALLISLLISLLVACDPHMTSGGCR